MKKRISAALISLALLTALSTPADTGSAPSGEPDTESSTTTWSAVFLRPGVPQQGPLEGLVSERAHSATLTIEGSERTWTFAADTAGNETTQYWVAGEFNEGMPSLGRLGLRPSEKGGLQGIWRYRSDSGLIQTLHVRLFPDLDLFLHRWEASQDPIRLGSPFPNLVLRGLDGAQIPLADLSGKPLVINYWATTCLPCVKELPELNQLVKEFASKEVVFLAIAFDSPDRVQEFLGEREFLYQQSLADEAASAVLGEAFPRNTLIDREGRVTFDRIGFGTNTPIEIRNALRELLQD